MLDFLYHTFFGRLCLKLLTQRKLSVAAGRFLDSHLSKFLIKPFVKNNGINLTDFESDDFRCFNDCFARKIKPNRRIVDMDETAFISPCDGLLSVYDIKEGLILPVKQSRYTIASLLRDKKLAAEFKDGYCLVFRLCVNHYHRYCYVDSGIKSDNRFIPGILHTVQPIALRERPVFTENCREYTLLKTENFGRIIQCEVGAMLVGRIVNYHKNGIFKKGEEKGRFEYGGSTIIQLVKKDAVKLLPEFLNAINTGHEVDVLYGQQIGNANNTL